MIIWRQILDYLSQDSHPHVILITSDNKEDWWWKFNGRVIGPRHELLEEVLSKTKADTFYMYNAEQFLRFSRDYLAAQVSQESIDQVRDVMQEKLPNRYLERFTKAHQVMEFMFNTLRQELDTDHDDLVYQETGFPDFIQSNQDGFNQGYEIRLIRNVQQIRLQLSDLVARANSGIEDKGLDHVTFVFVTEDDSQLYKLQRLVEEKLNGQIRVPVDVMLGVAHFDKNNQLLDVVFHDTIHIFREPQHN